MEFRHLRYFLAVAEENHITRAAERLGIQQPPLSQQIQALERELGVQLFRRKPRGVELTDAGRSFLADVRTILAHVEAARARIERTARGEQGDIVVGFTGSAPFHPFVPRVIRRYRDRVPLVTVTLQEHGTGALIEGLRAETIDAAFIRSPVDDRHGLALFTLFEEPMFAALPEDHPLAGGAAAERRSLAIADLAGEPFILYRRRFGPGFYDSIIAACHRAGFTPAIAQEAPHIVSTLSLVAAGLGITFVPASLRQLRMAGVAYRAVDADPPLTAPLNLACRATDHSAAARGFVSLVRTEARPADAGE